MCTMPIRLVVLALFSSCVACSGSTVLDPPTAEERVAQFYSGEERYMELIVYGEEAIPILLDVLSNEIETALVPTSMSRIGSATAALNHLAKDGIYTSESVPVLFQVIRRFPLVGETLIAAETVELISGTDVGYDDMFTEGVLLRTERERMALLDSWERMLANQN